MGIEEDREAMLAADPELREMVEREAPLRELQKQMILARQTAGLSQAEVARRMGTSRSTISRLESVNNDNWPTFDTVRDYARAVGCEIEVKFVGSQGDHQTVA